MSFNYFKRLLTVFLIVISVFIILMVAPRITGLLFPGKLPVGYHFENLAYLAVGLGLEEIVDLTPDIPSTITEIKDVE